MSHASPSPKHDAPYVFDLIHEPCFALVNCLTLMCVCVCSASSEIDDCSIVLHALVPWLSFELRRYERGIYLSIRTRLLSFVGDFQVHASDFAPTKQIHIWMLKQFRGDYPVFECDGIASFRFNVNKFDVNLISIPLTERTNFGQTKTIGNLLLKLTIPYDFGFRHRAMDTHSYIFAIVVKTENKAGWLPYTNSFAAIITVAVMVSCDGPMCGFASWFATSAVFSIYIYTFFVANRIDWMVWTVKHIRRNVELPEVISSIPHVYTKRTQQIDTCVIVYIHTKCV